MFKKKQHYKEDKRNLNVIKSQNDNLVCLNDNSEDSNKCDNSRGRQLNPKAVIIEKKNLTNGTTEAKFAVHSKKRTVNSKFNRSESYSKKEDYESSDSDCSIRNNKKKQLLESVDGDFPDTLKKFYNGEIKSLDNSEDLTETYEVSDDLVYNCEDNLTNEIERILIDIYNNHISFETKKKKLDISKYEKHIKFFSKTLNKQYNIFILQILSEKIKELINRYKEKIFEIPEIKQIRDRYYEIKASLVKKDQSFNSEKRQGHLRQIEETKVDNPSQELVKERGSLNSITINNKSAISNVHNYSINGNNNLNHPNGLLSCNSDDGSPNLNPLSNQSSSDLANKKIEFNEPDKSVTKILLLELRNIKKSLIESSKDIEKVFKLPLSHNKVIIFSVEEMHREEFTNTLIEDEFISALIAQIKTIAKQLKIEEINHLIAQIEEDVDSPRKEMSRFTNFLIEQLKSFIQSDFEEEDEEGNFSGGSELESETLTKPQNPASNLKDFPNYTTSGFPQYSNYQTNCTSNDSWSPKANIATDIGIDELIEYIEKAEEKKSKKGKKRLKKKKNKKEIPVTVEFDKEVENFRKMIYENSLNAANIKKIRPHISQEWLINIAQTFNVKS